MNSILYVDAGDDRMEWLTTLSHQGFTVLAAENMEAAAKAIESDGAISLILIDPASDGPDPKDVIALLNDREEHGRPELHVLTDQASTEQRTAWFTQGVDGVITKSTPSVLVEAKLRAAMKRSSRSMALHAAWTSAASSQISDPETGYLNERYLSRRMSEEAARAMREGRPLSLMLIELLSVTRIREEFGDQAAAECLRELAARVGETLRVYDVLCRIPPERLAVVLPVVDPMSAYSLAKRLLDILQGEPLGVRTPDGTAYRPVLAAVGIAGLVGDENALDPDLIEKAATRAVVDAIAEEGDVIGFVSIRELAESEASEDGDDAELETHSLPRQGETLEDFPLQDMSRLKNIPDLDFP